MDSVEKHAGSRPGLAKYRTGALTSVLLTGVALLLGPIRFDQQAPALGNTQSLVDARVDGQPARDNQRPISDVLDSLPVVGAAGKLIVWVGNSHQHAINGMQPGDTVSSVYLHRMLNGEHWPGLRPVFGISYPNLNFEEQFLLTLALCLLPAERRPAVLIHGVRFHDAREMGVRAGLRPLLRRPEVAAWMKQHREPEHAGAVAEIDRSIAEADEQATNEQGVEPWLVSNVGPFIPIFQRRDYIYYGALQGLHDARDRVFRIDTRSKRPILASRYQIAMQFLDWMAEAAERSGVGLFLYNDPLRQEVDNPYEPRQYESFRADLAALSSRHGSTFRDYDGLVPAELWGTWYKSSDPDFSHFTAAGHRLLAAQVRADAAPLIDGTSAALSAPGRERTGAVQ